jgi:hypothetical protein
VYDNHVNYTDTATYKDYNEYTNTYTYANHTDYNNYANQSIDYPHGFTLDIAEAGPDNWTTLTSSIPDIKKLREEIKRITDKYGTRKAISAEGALGASVGPIEWETLVSDNRDAEFGANKYARAAQINETINNVEKLWQAMRADASGLPALKNRGDRMRKQDYKTIIRKAQTLAQMEQPPEAGYLNHLDGNLFTKITPSKVYQQPAKVNENPTKVNKNSVKVVKATLVAGDQKANYIRSRIKLNNDSKKNNKP